MEKRTATPQAEAKAAGATALLIIDMVNDLDFEGGESLRESALAAAEVILRLRAAAERLGVPVIYVNDNFGQWHSEKTKLVAYSRRRGAPGAAIVERVQPGENDYFVIKPSFSGFYATNLPVLLPKLGASRLVLTGISADICVLFTAADAHMRNYELWIPADAVAGESGLRTEWALEIMRNSMAAETLPSSQLSLDDWIAEGDAEPARAAR